MYFSSLEVILRMDVKPHEIFIDEFDYMLPQQLIAAFPLATRDLSKLLVYKEGTIIDEAFINLSRFLPAQGMIILNNTKVIEARIFFQKDTGGVIEIFCLEPFIPLLVEEAMGQTKSVRWLCLIGGASKWKPGQLLYKTIQINGKEFMLTAKFINKQTDSFVVEFSWNGSIAFSEIIKAAGNIPLPPYIKRKPEAADAERYQTVFAQHQGSVAAPTAALHFTESVLAQLSKKNIVTAYITLHVGAGTFKPVKSPTIAEHEMHSENFSITDELLHSLLKAETIIAVGTTSLRTLESLHWLGVKLLKGADDFVLGQWEAYELEDGNSSYRQSLLALLAYMQNKKTQQLHCRTSLLILPGYQFRSAKALITNFHQPKSTLLLLVAAFIGADWKKVYAHALQNKYRFLSYGDSSLLWQNH